MEVKAHHWRTSVPPSQRVDGLRYVCPHLCVAFRSARKPKTLTQFGLPWAMSCIPPLQNGKASLIAGEFPRVHCPLHSLCAQWPLSLPLLHRRKRKVRSTSVVTPLSPSKEFDHMTKHLERSKKRTRLQHRRYKKVALATIGSKLRANEAVEKWYNLPKRPTIREIIRTSLVEEIRPQTSAAAYLGTKRKPIGRQEAEAAWRKVDHRAGGLMVEKDANSLKKV